MVQRFLLVWLTLISIVAWACARLAAAEQLPFDPFAATRPYLFWLITAVMFTVGTLMEREEIQNVLSNWPEVLKGTAAQYISMPLLAWLMAMAFGLNDDLFRGLILVGCVPGAMASNVLTLAARGNVSYSVSLTTASTMLSPLFVPAALYVTLHRAVSDPGAMARQAFVDLLVQVVCPVVIGHLMSRKIPAFCSAMKRIGPTLANLAILWIIAVVVNANHARLGQADGRLIGALVGLNLFGYLAGWVAGGMFRLDEAKRRALVIEIGMQNAGLGATLAGQLFPDRPLVALPPALFTFGCMLTGILLASAWAFHDRRRERLSPSAETPPDQGGS